MTAEALVVCVGASPSSEQLVRATARMAAAAGAPWHAVHVSLSAGTPLALEDRDRVEAHLSLAEALGAEIAYVLGPSVPEAIVEYAREHGATRLVVGRRAGGRWRDRLRPDLVHQLIREAGSIDLVVLAPTSAAPRRPPARPLTLAPYLHSVLAIAAATALGALVEGRLSTPDLAMIYLAAILVASLGGRGPGIAAAALAVATFNFFFIPPRYTFAVADLNHLVTFGVMFAVGTFTGTLVARLRAAVTASRERERRTRALLAFTAEAAAARSTADIAAAVVAQLDAALHAPAVVLAPDERGELEALAGLEPLAAQELAVAAWAFQHGAPAGRGTEVHPDARLLAVPLWDGEASAGVVAIQLDRARRRIELDARALLEGIARQAGVAMARLRLAGEAQASALRARTEEVRSALLSTVSHDLRTPLAIITGMATTLRDAATSLTAEQLEALDTIVDESARLGSILHNLLAITRVEAGAGLRRDWVPLEELIGAALGRCEPLLAEHAVKVVVDEDPGARVEPVLFEQLLINLVENAAKHTPPGTPIEIRLRADGGDAVIEVSDRGPGLPPGPPERLFEKFVRGPGVRTAGAGLGLAVCRGIAQAHGGTIEAVPREGGGATFRVRIAASAPARDEAAEEQLAS